MSDYWTVNGLVKPAEVIVCAANKYGDLIVTGARHHDKIMNNQLRLIKQVYEGISPVNCEQGFINQFGEFRTREEAMQIVLKNGQRFDVDRNGDDKCLYSEGLY